MKKKAIGALCLAFTITSTGIEVKAVNNTVDESKKITAEKQNIFNYKILPSLIHLDTPINGNTCKGSMLNISGWALNSDGITEVKVFTDNVFCGNASIGRERPDVDAVFPGYKDGKNSGYQYNLDISNLTSGRHDIKVQAINPNKEVSELICTIFIDKDKSLTTLLALDNPANGTTLTDGDINVNGWALSTNGIREINIFLDEKFQGKAKLGNSRPDVDKVFPGYPNGVNSGYEYKIDGKNLLAGEHKIKLQLVENNGKVKEVVTTVYVKKLPTLMVIDSPVNDSSLSNKDIKVRGWGISKKGVKEINVLIDEQFDGKATIGGERPDVDAAFPGYPNGKNSGYEYVIDGYKLSPGYHDIKVQLVENDGTKNELITTVKVKEDVKPSILCVDSPKNGTKSENTTIEVSGWTLNPSGVDKVLIYVDGKLNGQATYGTDRQDVDIAYPGYIEGKKSGYRYTLSTIGLSSGKHDIKIQSIGKNGKTTEALSTISVEKPSPITMIDSPVRGYNLGEMLQVRGWAVNANGVKSIKVYIDGTFMGEASYGGARSDLKFLEGKYPNPTQGGYNFVCDVKTLAPGKHIIEVVSQGQDGTISKEYVEVNKVANLSYKYYDNTLDYYVDKQLKDGGNVSYGSSEPATRNMIKEYMNPEKFISDSIEKYQFLLLNYVECVNGSELNKALQGNGILENKGESFMQGAKNNNINPIYLVAHAIHETGRGKSQLANGVIVTKVDGVSVEPKVVYNMYGVGAYDSDPVVAGSQYAYKKGWFTPEAAIIGGGKFISDNYINNTKYNQNTLYKMKWNLEVTWHQYATDIGWASKQTKYIDQIIKAIGKEPYMIYEVPSFKK